LNADLIKYIENTPDTVITLTNNEKILVDEQPDTIVRKTIDYARALRTPSTYLSDNISENS
jgi:flagellar protein FlbD